LRILGHPLYSTYGPAADTGGLFQNNAPSFISIRTSRPCWNPKRTAVLAHLCQAQAKRQRRNGREKPSKTPTNVSYPQPRSGSFRGLVRFLDSVVDLNGENGACKS